MNRILRLTQQSAGYNIHQIHDAFRCIASNQAHNIRDELLLHRPELELEDGDFMTRIAPLHTETWTDGTNFNVYASVWQPGAFMPWHSHLNDMTSIACLRGTFTELFKNDVGKISKCIYDNGSTFTIGHKIHTHCIGNMDVVDVLGLHFKTTNEK